jgi:heavy metal sensor kinase
MSLAIRTRLALWYVALLAAILAGLSAFILVRFRTDLVSSLDASLDLRAAQISLGYEGGGEGEFQDVTDATLIRLPQGEQAAQILSSTGQVLETSGDTVAEHPMVGRALLVRVLAGGRHVRETRALGPDHERFRILSLPAPRRPRSEVLVVATSLEGVDGSVHRLLVLLLAAGPAVLGAAALVGWWLARKALSPVARMTDQASSIGIDRLDERIAVPQVDDELGRLAHTLNAMLTRLEEGVREKRRFVADASHELRTPLAIMRSELEVSLRSGGLPPEAREILVSTAEEADRMSRIVENMLTLARIDEGRLQLLAAPVDLEELARSVVDSVRPLAERKGLRLRVRGGMAWVRADRERLHQAVANLVENAVKYTQPGGSVEVMVWRDSGEAGVTVTDTGPGIPPTALPRIFDRFVRLDPSRSREAGGSGLGLSICREIVKAHGGRVWAESEPGKGSSFSIAIPTAPRPQVPSKGAVAPGR